MHSIGHSSHSWETFSLLLARYNINAIADVRSSPFSGRFPQFSKDEVSSALRTSGIAYVFLGRELGGRPANSALFSGATADYEKMANAPLYKSGIERLIDGQRKFQIATMCSERDPLDCHRCLLVSRSLLSHGIDTHHILDDGSCVTQSMIEDRLLRRVGGGNEDLFLSPEERLQKAYREQSMRVAYSYSVSANDQ